MSSIQGCYPNYQTQPPARQATKPAAPQEADAPTRQSTQTDTYTKSDSERQIPKGAYLMGEMLVLPPDYGHVEGRASNPIIAKTDVTLSAKANVSGAGTSSSMNAEFKGTLLTEAVQYTDLERNIHKLLGFTVESFKTTLKASDEISTQSALADGSFFSTSLSNFAAAYSIQTKYNFDPYFQAQYNANPSKTVEYNFTSLKSMMESLVIKQNTDKSVTPYFSK